MKRLAFLLPLLALAAGCTSFEIDRGAAIRTPDARSSDNRPWPLWEEPDFLLPARRAAVAGGAADALAPAAWVSQPGTGADHASVFFLWPTGECLARDIDFWRTGIPPEYGGLTTNEVLARAFDPDFRDGAMGFWAADGDGVQIEIYTGHRNQYRTCFGRIDGDELVFDAHEQRKASEPPAELGERDRFPRPWVFRRRPMPAGMPTPDWTATRFSPPRAPRPPAPKADLRPFRWGLSFVGAENGFDVPEDASAPTFGGYDFAGVQFGLAGKPRSLSGAQFGIRPAAAEISGLQAGLLNADAVGRAQGVQIGLVNVFGPTLADARWLPLVNARF